MAQFQDLHKPYLSAEEEQQLAEFLITSARIGYGKTRAQVLEVVEEVATKKAINVKKHITDGWFRRKQKR